MWFALRYLYLPAVVLCFERPRIENVGEIGERFHFRRAVDGTRGRKYFDPGTDGWYDSFGSAGGNYDPDQTKSGFSDIRSNVPGEPGVSYPIYTSVPKTSFSCAGRNQGYHADEESGCQAFYVCNNIVVASFLCPIGSIFSQALLTCDWWNKVNCGMTSSYGILNQGSYTSDDEMVQKAYTMMQPPDHSEVRNNQQTGMRRRVKIKKIRIQPNQVSEFTTVGDRVTQDYTNLRTSEPKVEENYPFGRNNFDSNRQFQKDIINVHVEPQEFMVNGQEQGSIFNNPVEDSSVIYIQKNGDENLQDTYTPSRVSTFRNNFQDYYQPEVNDFGNRFKPSYAPTVPTVTTTTRRLYSPTVPTPYRPSTISYGNYDQDLEGSRHLYSTDNRGSDFLTTPPSITYRDGELENLHNPGSEQSDQSDEANTEEIQNPENLPENIQPIEPADEDQTNDSNLQYDGNRSPENIESENRSGFQSDQISIGNSYGTSTGDKTKTSREIDAMMNKSKETSTTLDSRFEIQPLIAQIPRPVRPPGQPPISITDQLFTSESFNLKQHLIPQSSQSSNENFAGVTEEKNVFDAPSPISPFISSISEPTGVPGINSPEISDQIQQTFQPATRISPLNSQTADSTIFQSASSSEAQSSSENDDRSISDVSAIPLISRVSPSIKPSRLNPTEEANDIIEVSRMDIVDSLLDTQTFESVTGIPPLITQDSQSPVSSGIRSPGKPNINNISQAPYSALPETQSSEANKDEYDFDVSRRIPSLAFQTWESASSSEIESPSVTNDYSIYRAPRKISFLIPEIVKSSASLKLPLKIRQAVKPTSSSGVQDQSEINVNSNPNEPAIPLLIPLNSQTIRPSEVDSINALSYTETSETFTNIPPLIPQNSQPIVPSGIASSSATTGDSITEARPQIPALIPQIPGSPASSASQSSVANNDRNFLDVSTRIPPLIRQAAQPTTSSGVQDQSEINVNSNPDEPAIPLLIPITSQTTPPSDIDSIEALFYTEIFEDFTTIPPLIPQNLQPLVPSGKETTSSTNDDSSTEAPLQISAVIPQIPESPASSGSQSSITSNGQNSFDVSIKIPLPIPQATQPTTSPGVQDQSKINVNSNPDEPVIPLLIPVTSQTTQPSEMDSIDALIYTQTSETSTRIPPLIPQDSRPIVPSEMESSSVPNDNSITEAPLQIPTLIPQIPQTPSSSESQSPLAGNDQNAFDYSTRIPPLIPEFTQSTSSSGVLETTTIIPLTIPQSSQPIAPSETESPSVTNDDSTTRGPPRISDLFPEISRPPTSPGSQSSVDSNNQDAFGVSDENDVPATSPLMPLPSQTIRPPEMDSIDSFTRPQTLENATRIPPLIVQIPQPESPSGMESSNVTDNVIITRLPPRISTLFPSATQASTSPESQSPEDTQFIPNVPTTIPPVIPQTSQTIPPSEIDSTDPFTDTQTLVTPTRIPPLFPQNFQPVPSEMESSGVTNDDGITDAPSRIPALIPQTQQPGISLGTDSLEDTFIQPFSNVPTRIPLLIPQVPQSALPPGMQSSSEVDDKSTFDVPAISPLFPQMPEPIEPVQKDPSDVDDRTQIPGTSFEIPLLIPQVPQPVVPSETPSTDVTGNENEASPGISSPVPQTPQFQISSGSQTGVNNDKKLLDTPSKMPTSVGQVSIPLPSLGTESTYPSFNIPSNFDFYYEVQSFDPVVNSKPATVVKFQGSYKNPSPFTIFQVPTGLPGRQQFVIAQTSNRAAYDFNQASESRLNIETKTQSPLAHSAQSTTGSFRINVPDLSSADEDKTSKDSFVRSTSTIFNSPNTNPPNTSAYSSTLVDIKNVNPAPRLNYTNQFPFSFSTTNYSQSKLFDRPSLAFNRFSTKPGDAFSTLNTKNIDASTPTEEKTSTSTPFTANVDGSRYNSFKQAKRPILQESRLVKLPEYNNDSADSSNLATKKNVDPSPKLNYTNQFPFGFSTTNYSQLKLFNRPLLAFNRFSTKPGDVFSTLNTKNIDASTPTEEKTSTSTPFTANVDGSRYNSFKQAERPILQESRLVKLPEDNKDSAYSPNFANNRNVDPLPKFNYTNRFPFGFSPTNYSQSRLFDRPTLAFNSFPTKLSDTFFTSNTKNIDASTPTVQKVSTSTPFTANVDGSRYNPFKQAEKPISQTPSPPSLAFNSFSTKLGDTFSTLNKKNIDASTPTKQKISTSTPFTANVDGSRDNLFKLTERPILQEPTPPSLAFNSFSTRPGDAFFTSNNKNIYASTPAEQKTSTSTPFTANIDGGRYNSFNQARRPIPQASTPIKLPEYNKDLQFTTSGALGKDSALASTQSPSPPGYFGNIKESFGSSTPKNIIGTESSSKTPENLYGTKYPIPKASQPSTPPPALPASLSQFETVASVTDDSPYEIKFTVNADEDFIPSADFISKLLAEQLGDESSDFGGLDGYEIVRSDSPDDTDDVKDVKLTPTPSIQPTIGPSVQPSTASTNPFGNQRNDQSGFSIYDSNRGITNPQAVQSPVQKVALSNSNVFPRPFFLGNNPNVALQAEVGPRFTDLSVSPSLTILESNTQYNKLRNGLDHSKIRVNPKDINSSLESLFESSPKVSEKPPLQMAQILEELKKQFGEPLYNTNSRTSFIPSEGARNAPDPKSEQQFVDLSRYRVRTNLVPGQQQSSSSLPEPPKTTIEELKKQFGEPLYNTNSRNSFISAEGARSAPDPKFGQQFVDLSRYRVRTNLAPGQQQLSSSLPELPKTTTTTTTTTTPKPVKTFVETEFIPSLGFSFDYDEGRKQYVEAILQGLLTENQFAGAQSDAANSNGESSQN